MRNLCLASGSHSAVGFDSLGPLKHSSESGGINREAVSNDMFNFVAVNADVLQHPVVQRFQRRYRRPDVAFPAKPPPPSDNRGCDRAAPPPQESRARPIRSSMRSAVE